MITPGSVRVCVFDAYGTLMDLSAMVERFRPDLGDRAEPLLKLWRKRQLEISWLPPQVVTKADFWLVTGEALDEAMAHFGLDDSALHTRLMRAWLEPAMYPDVASSLLRLRAAGIKTAILSNGTRQMLDEGVRAAGLGPALDALLSVEQAGVFKPEPAVYKLVNDRFQVSPQSVCFVSGNAWDVHGAARSGFQVVWINRTGARAENLPRGTAATIATLADLPALLGV
ncbi:haloacid dehalogenase [Paramagnetospirillum marisnigri]|uniref:(S)-2-haloacid dehalogenase n=1 Tax=Paramagnetospirillum marisnigri TaxID=1285242 RepID=A0A178M5M3_9PROT|nr:haloacid dehalogenase type II [Paramagnetospirillum marisnigri]OAN44060.1 haloacid dehalogenase [Paramagnetospirillum marisnigri]